MEKTKNKTKMLVNSPGEKPEVEENIAVSIISISLWLLIGQQPQRRK